MNKNSKALFNSHLTLDGFNEARSLTIMQGDKTDLEFILKDKNSEPIVLEQISGQAQIVDSERDTLVAVFNVNVEGSKATFNINKILPASEYEIYIKIGDYYFPSREDSFVLRVINSYDVVEDIDLDNVQTIDIVVDALRADIIEAMKPEVGSYVDQILADDPDRFKGEKGDKFTVNDFTEEEFNSLRGSDGQPFVFENFTTEQLENLKLKISESTVNENNETIVTFNDGSTLTIPRGAQGEKGEDGQSITFDDLTDEQKAELSGEDGLSAYQVAVDNGFTGSEYEWLESLKGQDGEDGQDGRSFDYESLTPEQKEEIKGEKGDKGDPLTWSDLTQTQIDELRGNDGNDGKSAYELALEMGFSGSLEEFLESLKGENGEDGRNFRYEDFTEGQLYDLGIRITHQDKDEEGNSIIFFSDGTTVTVAKGDKGVDGLHGNTTSVENNEDGSYDIVVTNPNSETEISRTTVRDGVDGTNGTDGIDGKSLRYEDLTPEQIAELQEGLPVRPPKIYTRAEYDALDSYDPHTLYFVVEEDEITQ